MIAVPMARAVIGTPGRGDQQTAACQRQVHVQSVIGLVPLRARTSFLLRNHVIAAAAGRVLRHAVWTVCALAGRRSRGGAVIRDEGIAGCRLDNGDWDSGRVVPDGHV